ncbi:MAG: AMP-binding protein, partial [bacterium]|nr:AMP-binding protein [bacterium]
EDIIVGSPIAGRGYAGLESIIGMFVNTLTLRNFPVGEKTFGQSLEEVKKRTLDSFENQDYQYEDLVERVVLEKDTGRNPLFDTMFALQNVDIPDVRIPGLKLTPFPFEQRVAKFDLLLECFEMDDRLSCTFEYCTALFKQETILKLAGYFKRIVVSVLDAPAVKMSEISIISEEEKKQVVFDFNDNKCDYPGDKTICQLFEEQVEREPWAVALAEESARITYSQLNERADRAANLLKQKNVGPGTITAIMIPPSFDMIIGILAILKAGGAYLPIDPQLPQERIDFMLKDSGAKLLITGQEVKWEIATNFVNLMELLPVLPSHLPIFPPSNLAYIIYTSGSTGKPKSVMVEHRSLVNLCNWHNTRYSVTSKDRAFKYANVGFDASVWEIFPYLIVGAELHILRDEIKSDLRQLNHYFETHHITIGFLPTQICEQFTAIPNRSLRVLLTGGDKLKQFRPG